MLSVFLASTYLLDGDDDDDDDDEDDDDGDSDDDDDDDVDDDDDWDHVVFRPFPRRANIGFAAFMFFT